MRVGLCFGVALVGLLPFNVATAQRPVTLADAINSALTRGPRVAVARADSAAAAARIATARAYPNPLAALGYSKSTPNYHFELEQEIEYPFLRAARIRAAQARLRAATYSLGAENSAIRFDVEVAYASAAATSAIRALSARNAAAALELLRITREREKVGDASELDVRLAAVVAGQAQNQAATDSLQATLALLELQAAMGLEAQRVEIIPTDTADFALGLAPTPPGPLRVLAAEQQLASERANVQLAQRGRIPNPSLRLGFEWHDPGGDTGLLPTVGVALPLPIWNRNGGPIKEARAAEARATAELALARLETQTAITLADHERVIARARVERGRTIVVEAQRVAALALIAYREGAYPLATVLEAQRNARDAVRQFILDVQASRISEAALVRANIVGGARP